MTKKLNETEKTTTIIMLKPKGKFEKATIIVSIIMAIIALITLINWIYPLIPQPQPNVVGYGVIQRITNSTSEGYQLWLSNEGEASATNIKIKVEFPFENSTITQIFNQDTELIINSSESGGVGSYFYVVRYSELRVNESTTLTFIVNVRDFEKVGTNIVIPKTTVWPGKEAPIEITQLKGRNFIH